MHHPSIPRALLWIAAPLLATLLASGPAVAQSVDSVTPGVGTVGTQLELLGTGFGAFKPKVWLASPDQPDKRRPVKVHLATGSVIRGSIRAGQLPEGAYRIFVDPKGDAPPFSGDALFIAVPPEIDDFQPKLLPPGGTVTIRGRHFGDRRGRVFHGNAKTKVISWRDDSIRIRVPKSGSAPLRVVSRSGEQVAFCGLSTGLGDPPATPPYLILSGDVQDYSGGPLLLRSRLEDGGGSLLVTAFTTATPPRLVELSLQVEADDIAPGTPTSLVAIDYVRVRTLDGNLATEEWVAVSPPSQPGDLQGQAGQCSVRGDLDVVLSRTAGSGPDELELHVLFRLDVGLIEDASGG